MAFSDLNVTVDVETEASECKTAALFSKGEEPMTGWARGQGFPGAEENQQQPLIKRYIPRRLLNVLVACLCKAVRLSIQFTLTISSSNSFAKISKSSITSFKT